MFRVSNAIHTMRHLLFAALLAVAMSSAAQAPAESPATQPMRAPYKLKLTPVGSHVPYTFATSIVPMDRTYARQTDAHRADFRSLFDTLAPDDEPPFPEFGMAAVFEQIATDISIPTMQGELDVQVTIGPDGRATAFRFRVHQSDDIAKAVGLVLLKTRFKPASCHGVPCTMDFPFQVVFLPRK